MGWILELARRPNLLLQEKYNVVEVLSVTKLDFFSKKPFLQPPLFIVKVIEDGPYNWKHWVGEGFFMARLCKKCTGVLQTYHIDAHVIILI